MHFRFALALLLLAGCWGTKTVDELQEALASQEGDEGGEGEQDAGDDEGSEGSDDDEGENASDDEQYEDAGADDGEDDGNDANTGASTQD